MSYNPVQKSVGYGPPGRFYDFSIVIESQQACGNKIEIELIVDDRLRSEFIAYSVGNSTKRTVRLTDYDRDRALKYAILSLPSSAREVTIECLGENGAIKEQCCTYDLYGCSFKSYSDQNRDVKHGKNNEAKEHRPELINTYSDLEVRARKKGVVELAKADFNEARYNDAEDYAPKTFEAANAEQIMAI